MPELVVLLGFRYEATSLGPDRDQARTGPQRGFDLEGLPPHPSLDRPADEALIAKLLPFHSPEYC